MASLITNDTGSAAAKSGGINSAIGANGEISNLFTTLLVAQIKNQNPLEPTDPAEFVARWPRLLCGHGAADGLEALFAEMEERPPVGLQPDNLTAIVLRFRPFRRDETALPANN